MAVLRRSGFLRSSGRSQRRKTSWQIGAQTGTDGSPQNIGSSVAQLATVGALAAEDGLTLVRTRGEFVAFLSATGSALDGFHGAFGIAVVANAAFVAGVGSLPTPITEENWDGWLYHRYFSLQAGDQLAVATAATQLNQSNATNAALRVEVDSKAMRKLETDMVIYACVEVIAFGVSAQMQWSFNSRSLVKLP